MVLWVSWMAILKGKQRACVSVCVYPFLGPILAVEDEDAVKRGPTSEEGWCQPGCKSHFL